MDHVYEGVKSDKRWRFKQLWQRVKLPKLPKKVIRIIFVVLTIAILGGASWLSIHKYRQYLARGVCREQVIKQAAPNLNEAKVAALEPIAKKVEKTRRFDKDVNCLYIVTSYYMYKGDFKKAQTYLDKIDKLYDPNKGFSYLFQPIPTPNSLHQRLDFQQNFQAELERNSKIWMGQQP